MNSGFKNRVLTCIDCQEQFGFTASAQEYFANLGYTNVPKRCKSCYHEFKKLQRQSAPSPSAHARM